MLNLSHISITNFNGPMALLLYLIQKEELDIFDITLKELTLHYLETIQDFDLKSDFLECISFLLLLKSRRLLPTATTVMDEDIQEIRSELINKLLEHMNFKDVADSLIKKEENEFNFFARGHNPFEEKKGLGLEEVAIQDLANKLQELLERAEKNGPKKIVWEEAFEIGPKILWLEETLSKIEHLSFDEVFTENKSRQEWIVLFLAILELIKAQKILIDKNLWIVKRPSPQEEKK